MLQEQQYILATDAEDALREYITKRKETPLFANVEA